jgi:hypothetical protein
MDQRAGDAAQRAILEWVDFSPAAPVSPENAAVEEGKPAETGSTETKDGKK